MQADLKQVSNLALFARIVQTGGISRCAEELGVERTTVSRRLANLESALGVRLLRRSPQSISVTEAGRLCFEHCEQILELARTAQTAATQGKQTLRANPIFLGAPPDLIEYFAAPIIAEFEQNNPLASIRLLPLFSLEAETIVGVDLAISWSDPGAARYVARRLTGLGQAVYASPELVARIGLPRAPNDIQRLPCIVIRQTDGRQVWGFSRRGETQGVVPGAQIEVGNVLEAMSSTLAGLGMGLLPRYLCEPHVKDGRLVSVYPDYDLNPRPLYIISPRRGVDKPRATLFRMFLEEELEERLELSKAIL